MLPQCRATPDGPSEAYAQRANRPSQLTRSSRLGTTQRFAILGRLGRPRLETPCCLPRPTSDATGADGPQAVAARARAAEWRRASTPLVGSVRPGGLYPLSPTATQPARALPTQQVQLPLSTRCRMRALRSLRARPTCYPCALSARALQFSGRQIGAEQPCTARHNAWICVDSVIRLVVVADPEGQTG